MILHGAIKLFCFISIVLIISCGQKSGDKKNTGIDSTDIITDTIPSLPPPDTLKPPSFVAKLISGLLKNKYGNDWMLVNDTVAKWPKDVFDYFIAPRRNTDPDYPYLQSADFNGDGEADAAALVVKNDKPAYQVIIIHSYTTLKPAYLTWKEDIDLTALSIYPKQELNGINGEKVKMKGDGIIVEYFEKSSFVIYWTGNTYKRVRTGD